MATQRDLQTRKAEFSAASIVAIVAAVVSFFITAGWGIVLAVVAMISGAVGFLMAIAPGVRGGIASVLSVMAGAAAIVVALIKLVVF